MIRMVEIKQCKMCAGAVPLSNHFRGSIISLCPHLLNSGLSKFSCSSTTWLRNDENLAQITSPLPSCVVLALQYKWFVQGFIHSVTASHPLTLATFVNTFVTSVWKTQKRFLGFYDYFDMLLVLIRMAGGWLYSTCQEKLYRIKQDQENLYHILYISVSIYEHHTFLKMPDVKVMSYVWQLFPHMLRYCWVSIRYKCLHHKTQTKQILNASTKTSIFHCWTTANFISLVE